MRSLGEVFIAKSVMGAIKVLIGSIIILIILGLVGCARPTGYTKANSSSFFTGTTSYGYKDKRINGDEFSIVVLGNKFTSKARTAEIALLRAAHLTKEQGRTHFVIIKQKTETIETAVPISLSLVGVLVSVAVGEQTNKEPMAILLIHLLPLQPPYSPDALNAAGVIEQLAKHLE